MIALGCAVLRAKQGRLTMDYGGFWVRVFAYLLDLIVLLIISIPLAVVFGVSVVDTSNGAMNFSYSMNDAASLVLIVAYFVGFEGSAKQATPGKMAMGLVVTNQRGGRISYLRALGRFAGKYLSAFILLIGFIMVAFTERKQGLHDMLAQTLVVRGKPGFVGFDPEEFA